MIGFRGGKIPEAYPELITTPVHISEAIDRYCAEQMASLNIDPNVVKAQMAEINRLNAILEKYGWHGIPEEGWNESTLPEVGAEIIVAELYTNPKRRIAYHSVTMNERQECITPDDDFLMDFDEVYAWKYIEPYEGG